jgi:pyruvate dehydrogenase E1 component alpha subunit
MIAPSPSSSATDRRALYLAMLRIRRVEEAIAARYADQEMRCPVHLSIGQEGIAVGVCSALEARDYAFSTHRAHAHYLAKGGDLRAFLAEIHGKEAGCSAGRGGSMHVIDLAANFLGATPIVGSSLPVGVGAAFGTVMQGQDRVTAIFFGDGSTEEGVFSEALNFAALKSLPVLFVCENNKYSVYSPLEVRQAPKRDVVAIAQAQGVRALRDDGNDVERVRALTLEAVAIARAGEGPTFLELSTYRWLEHCGPNYDNDLGYRSVAEFEAWRRRCPIDRLRNTMLAAGEIDDATLEHAEAAIAAEIDDAFAFARSAPFPEPDRLLVDEYATDLA